MARNIEPNFIQEPQRPHRHAELNQRSIDLLDARAFAEQPPGFVQVRRQDAVHQEARPIVHDDRRLVQFARQREHRRHRFIARVAARESLRRAACDLRD